LCLGLNTLTPKHSDRIIGFKQIVPCFLSPQPTAFVEAARRHNHIHMGIKDQVMGMVYNMMVSPVLPSNFLSRLKEDCEVSDSN
jgi:hypothetical protein